jgi:hypothetical protein
MGYRRALKAIGDKPTTDEAEIKRRFSAIVERRELLVKPPANYFNRRRRQVYDATMDPGGPPISRFLSDIDVRVTGFSDSVFLESPLGDVQSNPLIGVHTVVAASIVALLMNLKDASPLRGGIEIGFGLRNDGQLYSGATVTAVELEKCAKYPRVLIGANLLATLEGIAGSGDTVEGRLARTILSVLYQDPMDGLWGLDFMGPTSRRFYAAGFGADEIRRIWNFAQAARRDFDQRGMEKERGYYDRLIGYMQQRLSLWGIDEAS